MKSLLATIIAVSLLLAAGHALAGAKLTINDEASLNFGYRIQVLGLTTSDTDTDGDGSFDSVRNWKLRRARFRLGATISPKVSAFLQTDVAGGGKPMDMIDAWINFKADPWAQFIAGRNMAPANRQNLTSSGALMAIDRPGMAYKSLTWGARSLYAFSNKSYNAPGFSSPDAVRDQGLTLFGSGDVGEEGHFKYYAGMYNGIQGGSNDKDRITFRGQYNLWDAEPGYYNSSTYLGKKKTLGFGLSYDTQKEVASYLDMDDETMLVDYTYVSADVFLEYPTEGGALTLEGGWMSLDFGDDDMYLDHQGTGFYGQAGYYIDGGWQPWVEFESFSSDATSDEGEPGSYSNFRIGLSYYLEGQNANIKAGYEVFSPDVAPTEKDDAYKSFVLGFYTTY